MIILDRNSSETARSYAMRVLLYNIIHVELQPGSAVSENELSSALSLSRTPIREALIELNRIGLVEILPQRGSYISKMISFSLIYSAGDLPFNFLNERKKDVRELNPHCSERNAKVYLEADLSCTRIINSSTRYWLI